MRSGLKSLDFDLIQTRVVNMMSLDSTLKKLNFDFYINDS